jgi:hypothetical protein
LLACLDAGQVPDGTGVRFVLPLWAELAVIGCIVIVLAARPGSV